MSAPPEYPQINGVRYSWSSVIVNIGNQQFLGCKSVNFNEGVDPAKIHGTGQNIIGTTAGMYDADGDCEFYQQEADYIVSALGNGWMNRKLIVQVQYADDGQPTTNKILPVRFIKRTQGGSESADALTSKFTLFFTGPIISDGITGVPSVNPSIVPPVTLIIG